MDTSNSQVLGGVDANLSLIGDADVLDVLSDTEIAAEDFVGSYYDDADLQISGGDFYR